MQILAQSSWPGVGDCKRVSKFSLYKHDNSGHFLFKISHWRHPLNKILPSLAKNVSLWAKEWSHFVLYLFLWESLSLLIAKTFNENSYNWIWFKLRFSVQQKNNCSLFNIPTFYIVLHHRQLKIFNFQLKKYFNAVKKMFNWVSILFIQVFYESATNHLMYLKVKI